MARTFLFLFGLSMLILPCGGFAKPSGTFAYIMASDPQLLWGKYDDTSLPKEEWERTGLETNQHHAAAINNIHTQLGVMKPEAIVFNGDLTAYGHPKEWALFDQFYSKPDVVPYFPGLGNHDYANNVDDCWGGINEMFMFWGKNGCARNSLRRIKKFVKLNSNVVTNFDEGSHAYSWDRGTYHFVQLHFHPVYEKAQLDVNPSISWLRKDLLSATERGLNIVVNLHDFGEHMTEDNAEFREAMKDTNVVAIFAGHIHPHAGEVQLTRPITIQGRNVPFFRCGSASWNLLMHVTYHPEQMVLMSVDTSGGLAKQVSTTVLAVPFRLAKPLGAQIAPKQKGMCKLHTDCEGWGPGTYDMACCEGFCRKKQRDWTGIGYCPHECKGGCNLPPGTCHE